MMKSRLSSWIKVVGVAVVLLLAAGGGYYYFFTPSDALFQTSKNIYEFNYDRDAQDIKDLFASEHYWLSANEDYSVEFMLKKRAPNEWQPQYFGKFNIRVLRENGEFKGFTGYYKKSPFLGQLLFLAVKKEERGKGYGKMLIDYAIQALWNLGSRQILILTRTTNLKAQELYNRLGFQEFNRSDGFVYFVMKKP